MARNMVTDNQTTTMNHEDGPQAEPFHSDRVTEYPGDLNNILYLQVTHEILSDDIQKYVDAITQRRLHTLKRPDQSPRSMDFIEALEEKLNWRLVSATYPNTGDITVSSVKLTWKMSEGLTRGEGIARSMRHLGRGVDTELRSHYDSIRQYIRHEEQHVYSSLQFDTELLGRDRNIWIRDAKGDVFLIDTVRAWGLLKRLDILHMRRRRPGNTRGLSNYQMAAAYNCSLGVAYAQNFPFPESAAQGNTGEWIHSASADEGSVDGNSGRQGISKKNWLFNLGSLRAKSVFQRVSILRDLVGPSGPHHPPPSHFLLPARLIDIKRSKTSGKDVPLFLATGSEHIYELSEREIKQAYNGTYSMGHANHHSTSDPSEDDDPCFDPGVYKATDELKEYLTSPDSRPTEAELKELFEHHHTRLETKEGPFRGYLPIRRVFETKARMAHLLNVRTGMAVNGTNSVGQGMICKVVDLKMEA